MSQLHHVIAWCEIPVLDFARAKAFYEALLDHPIETMTMGPSTMGFLSSEPGQVSGAIVHGDGTAPSQSGTLVYLNGGDDLSVMLARVMRASAVKSGIPVVQMLSAIVPGASSGKPSFSAMTASSARSTMEICR